MLEEEEEQEEHEEDECQIASPDRAIQPGVLPPQRPDLIRYSSSVLFLAAGLVIETGPGQANPSRDRP
eukprot:7157155-Pyramimonas_sp.AAC.1